MGYYNVVAPCVVNDLHYVRPHAEPIEVDDDTAAELVESGCLTPYLPTGLSEQIAAIHAAVNVLTLSPPEEEPTASKRTRRRSAED